LGEAISFSSLRRRANLGRTHVGAGALGRHQQEHDVDRALVDRIEIDRLSEPREQTVRFIERSHPAMWNGNATTDAGRAQALALDQAVEQAALVELEH